MFAFEKQCSITFKLRLILLICIHCCHMVTAISPERQSARMSKITNDGLTRSGTGCFIVVTI